MVDTHFFKDPVLKWPYKYVLLLFLQVRWQKRFMDPSGKEIVKLISQDMAIDDYTKYSVEKPTDYTWRLRVKNIQVSCVNHVNTCVFYFFKKNII